MINTHAVAVQGFGSFTTGTGGGTPAPTDGLNKTLSPSMLSSSASVTSHVTMSRSMSGATILSTLIPPPAIISDSNVSFKRSTLSSGSSVTIGASSDLRPSISINADLSISIAPYLSKSLNPSSSYSRIASDVQYFSTPNERTWVLGESSGGFVLNKQDRYWYGPAIDPDEVLDYLIDFYTVLGEDDIHIVDVVVNNIIPYNAYTDGKRVVVWLSSGKVGEVALITLQVVTVSGRSYDRSFKVHVTNL